MARRHEREASGRRARVQQKDAARGALLPRGNRTLEARLRITLRDGHVRHASMREHEVGVLDGGPVLREDDRLERHPILVHSERLQVR